MIVHLFPKSKFTEEFIYFINRNFDQNKHQFVLYTNGEFTLPKELYNIENVFDSDAKSMIWLLRILKGADKIIFHNISVSLPILQLLFYNPKIVRKGIWLIWGGDLYCYRNERKKIVDQIVEYMRTKIIRNVACVATIAEGDYKLAKEWYHIGNKCNIRVDYCFYKEIQILEGLQKKIENSTTVQVMIGNSATKTNNHMQAFEMIEKVFDGHMELIVPLSYGNEEYAEQIENYGKKKFSKCFVPIRQYMEMDEYYQLLNSVDVAIFNNDRQQATGNILALIYLGKKVYMRTDTTMWDEYVNKQKYFIYDIKKFNEDYRKGNVYLTSDELQHNVSLAKEFYSVQNRVSDWKTCFELEL